jgi:hypothetical protein
MSGVDRRRLRLLAANLATNGLIFITNLFIVAGVIRHWNDYYPDF